MSNNVLAIMNKSKSKTIAALDLGTDKILCIIADIGETNVLSIRGVGHQKSQGIFASSITDMHSLEKAIITVVANAEKMANRNVDKLIVNIGGSHLSSQIVMAETPILSGVVKDYDMNNLANKVQIECKKQKRQPIHLIPIQYSVDNNNNIKNPKNMIGKTLSSNYHVVTESFGPLENIENCLRRCQLSARNYFVKSYASALACLTQNEKEMGALVIDIGAGDTSISLVSNKKFIYTKSIPLGGLAITKDIAIILNIDLQTAEKIKTVNSNLTLTSSEEHQFINININNEDDFRIAKVKKYELNNIIKSRLTEIFTLVKTIIERKGLKEAIGSNIVITGGTSLIPGIDIFASKILGKPTRIGYPINVNTDMNDSLSTPSFSSILGMLLFLQRKMSKIALEEYHNNGSYYCYDKKTIKKIVKWFMIT